MKTPSEISKTFNPLISNETYYYKGNKLYNVKKIRGLNFNGHDILANWKDKNDGNKEKLGKFYFKELIIEKSIPYQV